MQIDEPISVIQSENIEVLPIIRYRTATSWSFKDKVIGTAALISVSGLLLLAVLDENCRPSFITFANTFVAAYVGAQVSKNR